MSHKIRFVVATLVLITGISVYQFFDFFNTQDFSSANISRITEELPPETDTDKDGLSDTEESIWNTDFNDEDSDDDGYLDGEEVASGHDPTVPGPNDFLIAQNLTEKATDLLAAGILTKEIKKEDVGQSVFDQRVDSIALASIEDFYKSQTLPEVALLTQKGDRKSQEVYLESLALILQEDILSFAPTDENIPSPAQQTVYFARRSQDYKTIFNKIRSVPVPKGWEEVHQGILNLSHQISSDYEALAKFESDPLRATIALNDLRVMITPTIQEILKDVQRRITQNSLTPSGTFYQVLGILYR